MKVLNVKKEALHHRAVKINSQKEAYAKQKKGTVFSSNLLTDSLNGINKKNSSQVDLHQARPQEGLKAPRFSTEISKVKPSLEYTIQTIVYGEKISDYFVIKMAEITADDCDIVATVRMDQGKIIVDLDEDFDPRYLNISQEDFDEVVRKAAKALSDDNSSSDEKK